MPGGFRLISASNSASGSTSGDIIIQDGDVYGDGVNIAARLEALAEPGGIMVSRTVHDQVRDKLSFGFEDMGEQPVKNIARPSASPDDSSLTKRQPLAT